MNALEAHIGTAAVNNLLRLPGGPMTMEDLNAFLEDHGIHPASLTHKDQYQWKRSEILAARDRLQAALMPKPAAPGPDPFIRLRADMAQLLNDALAVSPIAQRLADDLGVLVDLALENKPAEQIITCLQAIFREVQANRDDARQEIQSLHSHLQAKLTSEIALVRKDINAGFARLEKLIEQATSRAAPVAAPASAKAPEKSVAPPPAPVAAPPAAPAKAPAVKKKVGIVGLIPSSSQLIQTEFGHAFDFKLIGPNEAGSVATWQDRDHIYFMKHGGAMKHLRELKHQGLANTQVSGVTALRSILATLAAPA